MSRHVAGGVEIPFIKARLDRLTHPTFSARCTCLLCDKMTIATSINPKTIASHCLGSTSPPIRSFRTFEIFRGAPLSRVIAESDSPWSLRAQFYQGPILDDVHLPPITHRQDHSDGCFTYINLPTTGGQSGANLTVGTDRQGHVCFDPTIEMPSRRTGSRSKLGLSNKSGVMSLLPSCALIGIVGDAVGKERVAAFGKSTRPISKSAQEDEGQSWTPGWMVLSEVLVGGTVERYLDEAGEAKRSESDLSVVSRKSGHDSVVSLDRVASCLYCIRMTVCCKDTIVISVAREEDISIM